MEKSLFNDYIRYCRMIGAESYITHGEVLSAIRRIRAGVIFNIEYSTVDDTVAFYLIVDGSMNFRCLITEIDGDFYFSTKEKSDNKSIRASKANATDFFRTSLEGKIKGFGLKVERELLN